MGLLDVVLPTVCAGCRRPGRSPCASCVETMRTVGWVPGVPMPVLAAVEYDGAVARDVVADVKFRNHRSSSLGWMADAIVAAVSWGSVAVDVVTWVPASRPGRRRRGFDQGRLLSREVGRRLRRPTHTLLERSDHTRQVGLGRDDRSNRVGIVARPGAVVREPGRVLLVDDVVTTGASMAAAAAALRSVGAASVVGAAFAHKR